LGFGLWVIRLFVFYCGVLVFFVFGFVGFSLGVLCVLFFVSCPTHGRFLGFQVGFGLVFLRFVFFGFFCVVFVFCFGRVLFLEFVFCGVLCLCCFWFWLWWVVYVLLCTVFLLGFVWGVNLLLFAVSFGVGGLFWVSDFWTNRNRRLPPPSPTNKQTTKPETNWLLIGFGGVVLGCWVCCCVWFFVLVFCSPCVCLSGGVCPVYALVLFASTFFCFFCLFFTCCQAHPAFVSCCVCYVFSCCWFLWQFFLSI